MRSVSPCKPAAGRCAVRDQPENMPHTISKRFAGNPERSARLPIAPGPALLVFVGGVVVEDNVNEPASRTVALEGIVMGRIDHQLIGLSAPGRKGCNELVEHTRPTPPVEAIVDRLGRPVSRRRIAPAQSVSGHEHDPADDPAIINVRNAVRQRKIWLNAAHLRNR